MKVINNFDTPIKNSQLKSGQYTPLHKKDAAAIGASLMAAVYSWIFFRATQ